MHTRQTSSPLKRYALSGSNRSAREIARIFASDEGDTSPNYQRGSVWTDDQRMGLVRSWIMNVPVPSIIINDRLFGPWPGGGPDGTPAGGSCYAVIDGKQRIETAIAWFEDELAVPASWFPKSDVEAPEHTEDGFYVRHSGLSRPAQRHQAMSWQLPVVEAQVSTIEEEASLYLLVNGAGTPQRQDDMLHAESVATG